MITFIIGLFAPKTDEAVIPTLRVLPSATLTPIPNTVVPTVEPTTLPSPTFEPTEVAIVDVTETNEAILAIVDATVFAFQTLDAQTQIASQPSLTSIPTQAFTPSFTQDNQAALAPVFASATAAMLAAQSVQPNQRNETPVATAVTLEAIAPQHIITPTIHPDVGKEVASFTLLVAAFEPVYEYIVQGEVSSYRCASLGVCQSSNDYSSGDIVEISGIVMNTDGVLMYRIDGWLGDSYIPGSTSTLSQTLLPLAPDAPVIENTNTGCTFTFYVVSGGANLRDCPSSDCELVATLSQGESVRLNEWVIGEMYEESAGWYQVWHGNDLGYIHESRLSCNASRFIRLFPFQMP